jgi:nitroimidazol reductase NimA-like FMN-containing flavoprotein (pyridoxamine 5'-phosphate oxidase superfamily)
MQPGAGTSKTLVVYDEIGEEECRELLGSHSFGRLAIVTGGQPIIFPVNYRFADDCVVFMSNEGTKLSGADLARVAFEVDNVDPKSGDGWSVVVVGTANDISDALDDRSEALRHLAVETAVPGKRTHWVEIVAQRITGRRLLHSSA